MNVGTNILVSYQPLQRCTRTLVRGLNLEGGQGVRFA